MKRWSTQLMIAAPFLPWLYIQYYNFLYQTASNFINWSPGGAGAAAGVFLFFATILFICGFIRAHDGWD